MISPQVKTPAEIIKTINIIHTALIAGQAIFALVVFTQSKQTSINLEGKDIYTLVIPTFALGSLLISNFLFKTLVAKTHTLPNLSGKLNAYQTAIIVRLALLESASIFAIVVYLLTGNFLFLLIALFLMIYGVLIRPTIEKIADDLQLGYDEKIQLQH